MHAILLIFHVESGAGYAIDALLATFIKMAQGIVHDSEKIHVSFTKLDVPVQSKLKKHVGSVLEYDPSSKDRAEHISMMDHVKRHNIDTIFVFDQPVWSPAYKYFRKAGVRKIISYWGAPISGLNSGIRLLLKKLDVLFTAGSPDHYIFESNAMAKTAIMGRGVPSSKVSVIYMGVDTEKYKPVSGKRNYAHEMFNIPQTRKIIYYSGHMEERKGVAVLVKAARYLYEHYGHREFHFLILGNKEGEERRYVKILDGSGASGHVTFGGYRGDIDKILPTCNIGVIASTGWDSFTMSALEIASCGLPLLVSDLQGLIETIDEGETGYVFKPGDYKELSERLITLIDNDVLLEIMGEKARQRILLRFSEQRHVNDLIALLNKVVSG